MQWIFECLLNLITLGTLCDDDDINEIFSDEQLFAVEEASWYVDIVNYLANKILPPKLTYQRRKKFFSYLKHYIWDDPFLYKQCADQIIRRCVPKKEMESILHHCHSCEVGGHCHSQFFANCDRCQRVWN